MAYKDWDESPKFKLGPWGADPELPDFIGDFQRNLRDFAVNVARPIGQQLDRMDPQEAFKKGSIYWDFRKQFLGLGISMDTLFSLSPSEQGHLFSTVNEELGYGDSGLAISMAASMLPRYIAMRMGNEFVSKALTDEMLGCWGITEPDHGSDTLDTNKQAFHTQGAYGRPNCIAKLTDGKVIINGQKSAWVSNGPIAEASILYCALDTGKGPDPHKGVCVVVPLDRPGVSRGKVLDKLGQRALAQGEIFFDNVEVDIDYLLAGPEDYKRAVYLIHTEANSLMGAIFAGCARSAYDLAWEYAHERKQGGVPIFRHQSVATRLFHMFRKVEIAKALATRVIQYNFTSKEPALQCGMTTKVTSTATAFEVASEAIQIFGGNGLTKAYPIEKIMRDARASMIEDGCNDILAIKGGNYLIDDAMLAAPQGQEQRQAAE